MYRVKKKNLTWIYADKNNTLFLFWLTAKNKKQFQICARAQNVNLFSFY